MKLFVVLVLLLMTCLSNTSAESTTVLVQSDWNTGSKMQIKFQVLSPVQDGWTMHLVFSKPLKYLEIWQADIVHQSDDGRVFDLENKSWNADIKECKIFSMLFNSHKVEVGETAATATVKFERKSPNENSGSGNACSSSTSAPPTNGPPTTTAMPVPSEETTSAKLVLDTKKIFKMQIRLQVLSLVKGGWKITLKFSKPIKLLKTGNARIIKHSADRSVFELENKKKNRNLKKCSFLEIPFRATKMVKGESAATATVIFERKSGNGNSGGNACGSATTAPPTNAPSTAKPNPTTKEATTQRTTLQPSTNGPTTTKPTGAPSPYDYDEVLHDSILFYEAQRSGKLPANNRVPWRKDSALGDKGSGGEDLTGGWYDAGDYVKFGFPMASSVTVLAWGLVEYRDAYQSAGELNAMLDCIKWPLDYFIKAHTTKFEFYGQVGDGDLDHAFWGRPEDMKMKRPAFKITKSNPGSDLAAETAAALAAASIAFKQTDSNYATTLLQHAEELYEFADKHRGKYSDAIPNAAKFYKSWSGYKDELVWGAAWLYKATKNPEYLTKAEQYYNEYGMNGKPWAFSWDDKKAGAQLLLAEITGKDSYKRDIKAYLDSWLPGGDVTYTPKGLAWRVQWGSNRYAANTAFLALVAADLGIEPTTYRGFAKNQIHYMLGDSGRSFVVGFGNNPPQKPHHSSSSCPLAPAPCDWGSDFEKPGPNAHVLYGALVGGPDAKDNYVDDRKDYVKNEVTTDYNAGFQSAVAGLKRLL